MLIAFLMIGMQNLEASESTLHSDKSISLADFLNEISFKHKVFFTYNPNVVSRTMLNRDEYSFAKLNKIIDKLEQKTTFDFEYLGNKYYVVYPKKVAAKKMDKVSALSTLTAGTVNDLRILQNTVKGKVVDETGTALPGVNIIEKGTAKGTISDFDGNYEIDVDENATLVFSYIGFGTVEENVGGRSTINVTMTEGMQLEEMIVTGSRTAPRRNWCKRIDLNRASHFW